VLTLTNEADGRLRDTELGGHGSLGHICLLPNPEDISLSELGVVGFFSDNHSPALNHFPDVIQLGAQVQVSRLDTDGSITRVQNVEAIGWPVIYPIRGYVCTNHSGGVQAESAISRLQAGSWPVPTLFSRWGISGHKPGKDLGLGGEFGGSSISPSGEWVAMPLPSTVMGRTPSSSRSGNVSFSVALDNRADHLSILARELT